MSTTLLYNMFGLAGYHYEGAERHDGGCLVHICHSPEHLRCPICHSPKLIRRGTVLRTFRTLPLGSRRTWLQLPVQRVWCVDCRNVHQVQIGFADPQKSYTHAFERYVLDLLQYCTIQDVARHLQISWATVKEISKRSLRRRYRRVNLRDVRQIAIDEISVGKGHFLTIVLNLKSGAVIFVGEGRTGRSLQPFFRHLRLGKRLQQIEAVAMDMSATFAHAVEQNLPHAVIVFDHFHIIQLYNQKLTRLRRELQQEAVELLHKDVIKGTSWLLLKNPENLTDAPNRAGKNEKQRLQEVLELNQPLAIAYFMREDLRQLWCQPDKTAAERFLRQWANQAYASGIRMLQEYGKFLQTHQHGILAWYDYRISTGPLEGTNNKIKTLQRRAYGFRDFEFFKLRILAMHQSKWKLVG